jgi:phytoene synthase
MNMASNFEKITKNKSTTFYRAIKLFPREIQTDIFALYAFLRTADDIVDEPQKNISPKQFKNNVLKAIEEEKTEDEIIGTFVKLFKKYNFKKEWLLALFESFEKDSKPPVRFKNYIELEKYIYGVAEVVGFMMAKIMKLPEEAYPYAGKLGRAMQLVNILRDIKEDLDMNRIYLPLEDLKRYNVTGIENCTPENKQKIQNLINFELERVNTLFKEAREGIKKIPPKIRKPIQLAANIYQYIGYKIKKNPEKIWQKKVKVTKTEVIIIMIKTYIYE